MAAESAFISPLTQIGLKVKEAEVYLALLELETATAYQIAQRCDVKKPTVYVILEEMRTKGLVLKVPHAKKALFAARDIDEYLREQENKLKSVRQILPKLHALGAKDKPGVYFFSGLRGLEQAINYKFEEMRGKKFCAFYGNQADTSAEVLHLYQVWDRKAVNADVSFDIIMAKNVTEQRNTDIIELSQENENVTIKFLTDYHYPPNQSIEIADDFVRIIDEKNLQATVIQNIQTAEAMRQFFRIIWEKGV